MVPHDGVSYQTEPLLEEPQVTTETVIEPLPLDESFAVPAGEEQIARAVAGLTGRG